jgi:CRP-like cAMP-binding protein
MPSHREDARFFAANRLLASLPPPDYARLRAALEPVRLAKGFVLYEVGDPVRYAYFLTSGMVSLLATTGEHAAVQVAMVGNEGIVGIPAFLRVNAMPYRVTVQLPTTALRLRASVLNAEVNSCGALTDALLRYLHMLVTQITQSAVCNRYHTIEARLCRWLLLSSDRAHSDILPLTQETLANMLGVQRTGVTAAAGALQRARLINYRRGKIRILDARGLKGTACECYRVVSEELAQFMAA